MHKKTTAVRTFKVRAIAAGLLVAFAATAHAAPSSGSSKTAQGVFVKMTTPIELAVEQNVQYQFVMSTAKDHFTNLWNGAAPTSKCTGSAGACAASVPPAPPAPAALDSKLEDIVLANRCVWMDGGMLEGGTYTQAVSSPPNAKPSYTYTYTYNVLPKRSDLLPPKTAWAFDRITSGASSADLDIDAQIAGESVLVSSQFPAPGKFSFSLLDAEGISRVADLVYTISEQTGAVAPMSLPVLSSVHSRTDLTIDSYNGGTNGNAALLWSALPASMSTILNNDATPNNNDGGADGSAMAVATVPKTTFTLPPGEYLINLSGTVKGNSASATMPFNIQKRTKITYVGSRCGQ